MTATTLASSQDIASTLSLRAAKILADSASQKNLGTDLLRELTASWQSASHVVERRREHRFPCDLAAVLAPVESKGRFLTGPPLLVRLKDVSRHGVGIVHPEPMPHRLVLLEFETAEKQSVRLLARLKWCRFKGATIYESGGQIWKILEAGEGPRIGAAAQGCEKTESATQTVPAGDRPTEQERTDD